MSTKTTFKRIALVAVAALGLGLLSVAPSSAQDQSRVAITAQDSTGTVGTAVCATVLHSAVSDNSQYGNQLNVGAALYDSPATSAKTTANAYTWTIPDTTTAVNTPAVLTNDSNTIPGWSNSTWVAQYLHTAAGRVSASLKLCLTPDKAGTYMTRIFGFPNGTTTAIFVDWTVVVTAPTPVAASTTAYASAIDSTTSGDFALATDATGTLSAAKAAGNLAGVFYVVQSNGSATNPLNAGGKLTVTMSGSGLAHVVALASACSATSAVRAMTSNLDTVGQKVCLYSDGTSGTGTVTWATGSTVLGSGSAAFYGAPAKYTLTTTYSVISTDAAVNPSTTAVSNSNRRSATVTVTDSNGVVVPNADVYMNSSNPLAVQGSYQKATSGATGLARFNLTGVAAGTSDLTFTNKRYATDPLITASNPEITAGPTTIRVGSTSADKVAVAFDKAEYAPGEIAVVTVTITDKNGLAVPRGKYQVFNSALSASRAFALGTAPGTANANATCVDALGIPGTAAATCAASGGYGNAGFTQSVPALEAGSVWISGNTGTATFTMNMPLAPGEVKLSGTTWTLLPNGLGISANAGTAVSATANVVADNSAALAAADAAAEATDAANAATDAANAAAEAADAATAAAQDAADAVAALSIQVSEMVDALKKQITALTNLIIKIQKKVKA